MAYTFRMTSDEVLKRENHEYSTPVSVVLNYHSLCFKAA